MAINTPRPTQMKLCTYTCMLWPTEYIHSYSMFVKKSNYESDIDRVPFPMHACSAGKGSLKFSKLLCHHTMKYMTVMYEQVIITIFGSFTIICRRTNTCAVSLALFRNPKTLDIKMGLPCDSSNRLELYIYSL